MICPALPEGREMAQKMVREERLELSRIAPLDPKSSAYASFATLARKSHIYCKAKNLTQLRAGSKSLHRPPALCLFRFLPVPGRGGASSGLFFP